MSTLEKGHGMEIAIGCVGLGLTIVGSAVGVGWKIGVLATQVSGLKDQVGAFVAARNGGSQCQRHEDAIAELRRDVEEIKS